MLNYYNFTSFVKTISYILYYIIIILYDIKIWNNFIFFIYKIFINVISTTITNNI